MDRRHQSSHQPVCRACDDDWSDLVVRIPDPAAGVDDDESTSVSWDSPCLSDAELLEVRGAVSEWDLPLLASIDPVSLVGRWARLDYLRRIEAVEAMVAAMKTRAVVSLAGVESSETFAGERHVAMEVAQVRRVGETAASTSIEVARALHSTFRSFLAALRAGDVSEYHCRELVTGTRHVRDASVLAALESRLLPKAKRTTGGEFRLEIAKAVADLDAAAAAERVARARESRRVTCRPIEDGLGFLGIVHDWPTISAIHAAITADGRALQLERGGAAAVRAGDDDAAADVCRADAAAARMLGRVDEDGSLAWNRSEQQVTLTVVMDLDTLRGEAGRVALVDGEPFPAGIARQYADAATNWRRAVTDPVTGHLLDYGAVQYLPEKLRDYILARDRCRVPGCTTRAASRLEMDHAVPFPDGGTSATNCGGLCRKHHQLKTEGRADVRDSEADGSATWVTAWGQRIRIDPRPFLHDPVDHQPGPEPPAQQPDSTCEDADPPPF
jgi:hypothetical protein